MADLIERGAAIRIAEEYKRENLAKGYYKDAAVFDFIAAFIKKLPAVNRWIPCIERLPKPLQNVIVCTDINTVTVAWLNGDHWTFADTGGGHTENWSFDAVKYWMYLPEPPEKE